MTKEQKAEYRQKQLEKEVEDLKREKAMSEMAGIAREMIAEEGINIPDKLLESLVREDATKTKETVEGFCKLFKESVQKAVKDALKSDPPSKGGSSGITKEQILEIKDPFERQKKIAENIELFG